MGKMSNKVAEEEVMVVRLKRLLQALRGFVLPSTVQNSSNTVKELHQRTVT
jgi:hypothetical protein